MRRWQRLLFVVALFLCILSGYALSFNVDQPSSNGDWYLRYQVTCGIVEHNSFAVTPYRADNRSGSGLHHSIYTEYTLGQSVAMIPLYLLGRWLAGLPHTDCAAAVAPAVVLLTCKALDPVVGAFLCLLFFGTARALGYRRPVALALTLLLAFASSLWPDVLSNLEHTLESLFLLAAVYAALRYTARPQPRWLIAAGLAAGLVVVVRIAGLIVLPIVPLYLLWLHRRTLSALPRLWGLFALGVVPALAITGYYNLARFGSPLRATPSNDHALGYPLWLGLPGLLVSPGKGLLWYSPLLLLLPLVLPTFLRRRPQASVLFTLTVALYLLFYSGVSYWHGDPAWGPRYLFALLPYLILPLGDLFHRWPGYRPLQRGAITTVLAASFLVQISGVTVSLWRHYHYVLGYHLDQTHHHLWGTDEGYYWRPSQSPILYNLGSLVDMARSYHLQRPLLTNGTAVHLGSADDNCALHPFGQVALCLTDQDAVLYRAAFNTLAPWWLHVYPGWDERRVGLVALLLSALCISSGAIVIGGAAGRRSQRHDVITERPSDEGTVLRRIGHAALLATGAYGLLIGLGWLTPSLAPAAIRGLLAPAAWVVDNGWAYRIEGAWSFYTAPDLPAPGQPYRYVAVALRVHNLWHQPSALRLGYFALTDPTGHNWVQDKPLAGPVATLLDLRPIWLPMRPDETVTTVVVFLVRGDARHLELLGPGLNRLTLPPLRPLPAQSQIYVAR